MNITPTHIDGVYIIEPRVFSDARGHFFESYNKLRLEEKGMNTPLCKIINQNQVMV